MTRTPADDAQKRPSLKQSTAASFWLEYLLDAALQAGIDLTDELIRLGVSDAQLEAPQARISLETENALFDAALQRSDDPLFGLHMGEHVRPRFLGELGYASMSSATLGDAIELMIPFNAVSSEFTRLRFAWQDGNLWLIWDTPFEHLPSCPARLEAMFAASITYGRWLIGAERNPLAVHFKHAPQGELHEYQRLFRCPVTFEAQDYAVCLEAELLDLPLPDADAEVHRLARNRMQQAVTRYHARDDLLQQVRLEIEKRLQQGVPQLEMIAEQLGMKPWTLRRRLRAEGTDFSALLEDHRRQLACDWLRHSQRSVNQIALELGYSEQSAFNRAFKRWLGVTPLHYREQPDPASR
ncbi:AraC family transcriptional regulator [Alcanivorax hongdengensis A-11-3]|uniref:AraC family transcriptional regulator n=1 Tax=Alcanivorax hongdengensis A-11-3 TaxID=1177179 RepID=L0W8D3_9GAMM|nr:AraC family transcriptional regulator [Alcanivorax hongdengensis]EKF72968.1 AraC family transcriptional regulator [Alcanivorax hongdengensis A-11-3]